MKRIMIIAMVVVLGGLMWAMPVLAAPGNGNGNGQPGQFEYGPGPSPNGEANGIDPTATTPPYGQAKGQDAQGKGQGKGQGKAPAE